MAPTLYTASGGPVDSLPRLKRQGEKSKEMETINPVRRNVIGHYYTVTLIRRTPSKQRRNFPDAPWQFFAEWDNDYHLPMWYPASTETINQLRKGGSDDTGNAA